MVEGEENLIKEARRQKPEAFGLLYDRYQPKIYRFIFIKVGERWAAEDLTHQVFLNAWQNISGYRHRGFPFSSWLYQIARNQVIDFYRSKKFSERLDNLDPEDLPSTEYLEKKIDQAIELEKTMKNIQKLKPEYQDVLIMRFVEDLSLKEVAAVLKKSEGAIKLLQHRAVNELKNLLT